MKKHIFYKVTYTTIDNKVREVIWNVTHIDDYILNNILEYVQTGEWRNTHSSDRNWNVYWGLCNFESAWNPAGHSRLWKLPNKSQYTFYHDLIQCTLVHQLSKECVLDTDFGKAMLKEATSKAKQRDDEVVANYIAAGRNGLAKTCSHHYRDALTRAKNRIRYYHKKYTHDISEKSEFSNVIEEYNLFNILSIQRCS